jgi:uroporphyrinogen decarboxylase
MRSTGMAAAAYHRLKKHLGVQGGATLVYDMVQQLAMPEQWLLDRFQVDVVDLSRAYCDDPSEWLDWTLPDGTPVKRPAWIPIERANDSWLYRAPDGVVLAEMPPNGFYFDQRCFPLMGVDEREFSRLQPYIDRVMWSAMAAPLWNCARQPGFYEELRRRAKRLYASTDYAIMVAYGAQLLEMGQFLCRIDNFLADLAGNRKRAEALLDRLVELHLAGLDRFLEAVGPYVQVIQVGDDLGAQNGPQISPRMFKELFLPRYKAIYGAIKKKSNLSIFMHTCGSIYSLLPYIIEAGVDIINPVQTSAAEMEPRRLKEEFGRDIVFWGGGCDTQYILPNGTPEQVRADVEERVSILAPGGGFVFAPVHNVLADVPAANVLALYDAFKRVRDYPVRRSI